MHHMDTVSSYAMSETEMSPVMLLSVSSYAMSGTKTCIRQERYPLLNSETLLKS